MNYLLLIEDRPGQVDYIRSALARIDDLEIVSVSTLEEYRQRIEERDWDAAIADLQLPPSVGVVADVTSGRALLQDLWPRLATQRLLILTVHLDDEVVQGYLERLGLLDRAFPKMPSPERLDRLVRTMLSA